MGKSASAEKLKGSLSSAKAFSRRGNSLILGSISAEASMTFWPFSLRIVADEKKKKQQAHTEMPANLFLYFFI